MSYILDALRRADAERERGAVPSLHTQQYGALPGDEDEAPRRSRVATIVAVVLAVALLAVLGWQYVGGAAPPPAPATVAAAPSPVIAAPAPVTAATVPASAATVPLDAVPFIRPASAAGIGPGGDVGSGRAAATPSPTPKDTRRATKRELATAPPATAFPTTPSAGNATATAPPVAATGDRIYAMTDLPDDIRRDLPKLAFGGASYSSDAGSRMVILNGQVFHEGDGVARGVVLQRVNRKSAILAVRGYRFELAF